MTCFKGSSFLARFEGYQGTKRMGNYEIIRKLISWATLSTYLKLDRLSKSCLSLSCNGWIFYENMASI
jgi:hypothetical protein